MSRTRTAVLISGRGSNMTVLVEAAKAADYPAEIALVLSNRPEAAGLAYAAGQRIPTLALDHRAYPDRGSFDAALDGALREAGIELVVLAGFMRILTPGFVEAWAGRMINIHPSLLPLFRGTHTHEQALAARVLVQEHRLYPAALAMIASGRARLEGGRVILAEAARDAGGALLSL